MAASAAASSAGAMGLAGTPTPPTRPPQMPIGQAVRSLVPPAPPALPASGEMLGSASSIASPSATASMAASAAASSAGAMGFAATLLASTSAASSGSPPPPELTSDTAFPSGSSDAGTKQKQKKQDEPCVATGVPIENVMGAVPEDTPVGVAVADGAPVRARTAQPEACRHVSSRHMIDTLRLQEKPRASISPKELFCLPWPKPPHATAQEWRCSCCPTFEDFELAHKTDLLPKLVADASNFRYFCFSEEPVRMFKCDSKGRSVLALPFCCLLAASFCCWLAASVVACLLLLALLLIALA